MDRKWILIQEFNTHISERKIMYTKGSKYKICTGWGVSYLIVRY